MAAWFKCNVNGCAARIVVFFETVFECVAFCVKRSVDMMISFADDDAVFYDYGSD